MSAVIFLVLDDKALLLSQKIEPILLQMRLYLDSLIASQQLSILQALDEFRAGLQQAGAD